MPNYQVLRCADDACSKFQSQQEKKSGKWKCVVCGLKQSLKHVYFQSSIPKECRAVVMELNMKRGQIQAAKEQCAQSVYEIQRTAVPGVSSQADSNAATHSEQQAPEHAQSSKWDRFTDKPDDLHDLHDNGPDLDKHNRIVVGRVEKRISAVHKGSKRTPKQKHGTEHAAPASSNRSALSQALAAMSRQTHQTKQQQSAVAAQSTPAPIPTSTDIPAIAAAKAPAAKSKQPGPAADKPQEPSRWDAFADDSDSD